MPIDYLAVRPKAALDIECLPNFFAIGFRDAETKKRALIWTFEDEQPLDRPRIARLVRHYRLYTFNGIHYDMPMMALAMTGATCEELKAASDDIILGGLKHWQFYDKYGVKLPDFLDHIDLMEVAPAAAQRFSLKKYGGTMHSRTMMEFEHDFEQPLKRDQIEDCLTYLGNDLELTCDLLQELEPDLNLRAAISADTRHDFRSKSNAQCGETIVKLLAEKRTGKRIYKPDIRPGLFKYEAPSYIKFKTPEMQELLSEVLRSSFRVKPDGYVVMPDVLEERAIPLGSSVFRMGIGGLHSHEQSVSHYATDSVRIVDRDVRGYYPNLMIKSGREPKNLRGQFQPIFRRIVEEREISKKEAQRVGDEIALLEAAIAKLRHAKEKL